MEISAIWRKCHWAARTGFQSVHPTIITATSEPLVGWGFARVQKSCKEHSKLISGTVTYVVWCSDSWGREVFIIFEGVVCSTFRERSWNEIGNDKPRSEGGILVAMLQPWVYLCLTGACMQLYMWHISVIWMAIYNSKNVLKPQQTPQGVRKCTGKVFYSNKEEKGVFHIMQKIWIWWRWHFKSAGNWWAHWS